MKEWNEKHTPLANEIEALVSDIEWLNRELRAQSADEGLNHQREEDLKAQLDAANESLAEGRAQLRRMTEEAS